MSEFTSGYLIEHKNANKVAKYAQTGAVLKQINEIVGHSSSVTKEGFFLFKKTTIVLGS